jgi:hypothetical protein
VLKNGETCLQNTMSRAKNKQNDTTFPAELTLQ